MNAATLKDKVSSVEIGGRKVHQIDPGAVGVAILIKVDHIGNAVLVNVELNAGPGAHLGDQQLIKGQRRATVLVAQVPQVNAVEPVESRLRAHSILKVFNAIEEEIASKEEPVGASAADESVARRPAIDAIVAFPAVD